MASTIKERCVRRLEGLKLQRKPFEAEVKEIASYTSPAKSRFLSTQQQNKGRQPNKRLYNGHGIQAFRTLQGGMHSGLSSQSRPWFTIKADDEIGDLPEVRIWCGEVERRMYSFMAATNFYEACKANYYEIGGFGTAATITMEHSQAGMVAHALTFGEYWIGLNDQLRAGALYRDCAMTALQAVTQFGLNNVSDRVRRFYDTSQYETVIQYYQAIEENPDLVDRALGPAGKAWRSIYWDDGDSSENGLTQMNGFNEQPFWAPRWDTTGGDSYGTGPGHDTLPDLRELQLQTKRKAEATDFLVHPEIVAAAKVHLKRQPKSVVNMGAVDDVGKLVDVPYSVPYQAVEAIREDIVRLETKVNEASYADLFMAITNMQGVQPRNIEEIAARNEEKLTQLGPVIERVNGEMLEVAIDRVFGIMSRMNMLPPPPEALQRSRNIKIEFVSILTQMQRMVGLGQIERATNFVGSIAAVYPEARHKLDPMALVDEYWDRAGAPAKLLRSTDDAQADADAEAQQAQAAQMAEQAPNISKPFKEMTDAAKVAAEIPGSAIPPVEDLVPVVPR